MTNSTRRNLASIGGCGCGLNSCLGFLLVNLLFGSICARYCLFHWLPVLHNAYPTYIGTLDPNTSVWSLKIMVLGIVGGELFIPGAIITWLLIGLHIVTL
jgi:hypothetical protein